MGTRGDRYLAKQRKESLHTGFFHPDAESILPEQLLEGPADNAEKALARAVLEDAMTILAKGEPHRRKGQSGAVVTSKDYWDAVAWTWEDMDGDYVFSLEGVCTTLGLNAQAIRELATKAGLQPIRRRRRPAHQAKIYLLRPADLIRFHKRAYIQATRDRRDYWIRRRKEQKNGKNPQLHPARGITCRPAQKEPA